MTAQKLFSILKFLESLDLELRLQTNLEAISSALNNLTSQPAQPQYQNALASALAEFTSAVDKMRERLAPSQLVVIKELGGEEFFDPTIADKVRTMVEKNAMTPSVARDFVKNLASRPKSFSQRSRAPERVFRSSTLANRRSRPVEPMWPS